MTDPIKATAPPKDPPKDPPKEEVILVEKAPPRPVNPATGKKYKKGEVPVGWNQPCE